MYALLASAPVPTHQREHVAGALSKRLRNRLTPQLEVLHDDLDDVLLGQQVGTQSVSVDESIVVAKALEKVVQVVFRLNGCVGRSRLGCAAQHLCRKHTPLVEAGHCSAGGEGARREGERRVGSGVGSVAGSGREASRERRERARATARMQFTRNTRARRVEARRVARPAHMPTGTWHASGRIATAVEPFAKGIVPPLFVVVAVAGFIAVVFGAARLSKARLALEEMRNDLATCKEALVHLLLYGGPSQWHDHNGKRGKGTHLHAGQGGLMAAKLDRHDAIGLLLQAGEERGRSVAYVPHTLLLGTHIPQHHVGHLAQRLAFLAHILLEIE